MRKTKFTKLLCLVLSLVMILGAAPITGITALAAPELSNGQSFYTKQDGTGSGKVLKFTVTDGTNVSISTGTDYPDGPLNIPSSVEYDGVTYSVTSIGNDAFGSGQITSVSIPNSVTSIGEGAFNGCARITSVSIPDSVQSIEKKTFRGCYSLTSVSIPNSVTSIGESAFDDCGLTSVNIPSSVTSIGAYAFRSCRSLSSVSIPDSVQSIGGGAFEYCSSLTSVTIPSSVQSIESNAFYNCTNLTSVTIPSSVKSIGYQAFDNCTNLSSVTIPSSVTSIGGMAFYYCTKLTSVTIPSSVQSIGDCAFQYCTKLTSVTIPSSVQSIGAYTFENCTNLTSVTIPSSVTSIRAYAFRSCASLSSVTIKGSSVSVADSAFLNVGSSSAPTKLILPDDFTNKPTGTENVTWGGGNFGKVLFLKDVTVGVGITNGTVTVDKESAVKDETVTVTVTPNANSLIDTLTVTKESGGTVPTSPVTGEDGKYTFTMPDDDVTVSATFILAHTHEVDLDSMTAAVAATCTEDGTIEWYSCKDTNCEAMLDAEGNEITDNIIPALGHNFTNYVSDGNATCTEDGTKTAKCENCTETDTIADEGSKLDHSYTGEVKANNDGTHSFKCVNGCDNYGGTVNCSGGTATCTEKAVCSVCKAEYGNANGHRFTTYTSDNNATCLADGTKTAKCENCTETDTVTDEGSKKAHSYTGAYKDNGDGTHSQKCVNGCENYGNPTAHTGMEDFICDDCGYTDVAGQLEKAKEEAKAAIEAAIEADDPESVTTAAEEAKAAIENAESVDEVEAAKTSGLEKMEDVRGRCPYCGMRHEGFVDWFACSLLKIAKYIIELFDFLKPYMAKISDNG